MLKQGSYTGNSDTLLRFILHSLTTIWLLLCRRTVKHRKARCDNHQQAFSCFGRNCAEPTKFTLQRWSVRACRSSPTSALWSQPAHPQPRCSQWKFFSIPENQLHAPGVHVELESSFIVLHVCVLALWHLYSCDSRYTVLLMLIAHKTKLWVPTALRAGIDSQQPSHPLQRRWL